MVEGIVSVAVWPSLKLELDKIKSEKGYSSYNKVIMYLVDHWKESYKVGEVKK